MCSEVKLYEAYNNSGRSWLQRWMQRHLSPGAVFSVGAHAALAVVFLGAPQQSGTAQHRSEASSASRVVTLVIDSIADDEAPPKDMASGVLVVTPLPAAAPPAPAPEPPDVKKPEDASGEMVPINAAQAEVAVAVLEMQTPIVPETPAPRDAKPEDAPAVQPAAEASAATAVFAGPVTPAPPQVAVVSASQGDMLRYANKVRTKLAAHRPPGIGANGKVVVTFTIGSAGTVAQVDVAQSSGSARLDRVAVTSVRSASPFPAPPQGSTAQQLTFSIPFDFR